MFSEASHSEYIWTERQTDTHFATTNADQGAIRLEQSTALGFAQSPLASLSLWPEIMWSDYAHGSSDVFPEEFDRDGGGEEGEEGNRLPREQPKLWPDFIILDASNQFTFMVMGIVFCNQLPYFMLNVLLWLVLSSFRPYSVQDDTWY